MVRCDFHCEYNGSTVVHLLTVLFKNITGVPRPEVAWVNLLFRRSHDLPIFLADRERASMFLFGNTKELLVGNTCVRFSLLPIFSVSHFNDAHVFCFAVDFPHFGQFDLHY